MSTVFEPTTTTDRPALTSDVPYRHTVDEFYRMVDAGIFPTDRRVYLWDGRIYEAMAKTLPHSVSFSKVLSTFYRILPSDWCVWPENPITISDDKAPLPDVTILRGQPDDYSRRGHFPEPTDVGLVVEISKSSARNDTRSKLEQYARSGVPAYWVLNLNTRRLMACAEPRVEDGVGVYGSVTTHGPDDAVPLVLDGREIARVAVRDLLDPGPGPAAKG